MFCIFGSEALHHLAPTSFLYAASSFLRPEGIEVGSHSFQLLAWDIPPRCFEENLKGDTFFSDVAYCFGSLWMPDPFQRLRDRESATPGKERGGLGGHSPPTRSKAAFCNIYIYIYIMYDIIIIIYSSPLRGSESCGACVKPFGACRRPWLCLIQYSAAHPKTSKLIHCVSCLARAAALSIFC